ncbi:MAG TPA: hypothetical protein VFV75_19700 [Candidatus Polarisedimenticolaceae bacterium]|nr:hypothetical protein [Candidatus Polarisedimenticolaceae bacterium]
MRSRSALAGTRRRAERLAAMTPDERMCLAERLGEEGLLVYMTVQRVDRRTAAATIKATRRLGRRPSASADVDEH